MNNLQLPKEYQWVDLSNLQFSQALELSLNSDRNLMIQGRAGSGKSLLIKMISSIKKNVVVLSTTGITAVELSSEKIAAKTIHSFLSIPPVPLFSSNDIYMMGPKNARILNEAEVIIIDEVSMMSNNLFDFVCEKILRHRRGKEIPRIILFGDVLQLPPVIDLKNDLVAAYFKEKYDNKFMFFNSEWYKDLNFKLLHLRKSYRQDEQDFAEKLFQVGYRDHSEETLDYFNQRVMSLAQFEKLHKNYIYMSPTNAVVDKINNDYMKTLTGKKITYKASMSANFPKDKKPNNDIVDIRIGAQVMCLVNNYERKYVNGTIGEVIEVEPEFLTIEHDGENKKVEKTTFNIYDMVIDSSGNIDKKSIGWYKQIDAKVCRAVTIHKMQGRTLDSGYISLQNWIPPGIIYVALSRLRTLNGLGLSRPLKEEDIKLNTEAFDFLEG